MFLAQSGDVIGILSTRVSNFDRVFAGGVPHILSCNTSKVWLFP